MSNGYWLEKYNGNGCNDYWDYKCSICKTVFERFQPYKYCPECGSIMLIVKEVNEDGFRRVCTN